jgi:RNA polymerase sigma-70 factor (ECF subfamily)
MEQTWDLREAVCRIGVDSMDAISDESLMFLLRNETDQNRGNDVFAEMHRRYQGRVLSWCRRLTRNREGANDLAQEVFLRAFRYRHTFRGDSSLSTWLYVITRNYCMNALKKCGRDPIAGADLVSPAVAGSDGTETHTQVANSQAFEALWVLIHRTLTPLEARVMALHYGHGLPLGVITRQLMLANPSGAKAYIVNARRKLNAVLQGRTLKSRPAAGDGRIAAAA